MAFIKISRDFTETPGARYLTDGEYSGQQFRNEKLIPLFENTEDIITIDLDDTDGYATSFLEEAFGGLARIMPSKEIKQRLKFISDQEPSLIEEIFGYIDNA